MKLKIASDLHLEFFFDRGKRFIENVFDNSADADVLIIAGDIMTLDTVENVHATLKLFCDRYAQVVYVTGNHEHWGSSIIDGKKLLRNAAVGLSNLTVLDTGRVAEIHGRRFLGGTMWFPRGRVTQMFGHDWSDFRFIQNSVATIHGENDRFITFLEREMRAGDIVITHHLPSYKSVAPQYDGQASNAFFVHELDGLIKRVKPTLWVHGHTHTGCQYKIGDTLVVCNPRGYPSSKEIKLWNPNLIVEVTDGT